MKPDILMTLVVFSLVLAFVLETLNIVTHLAGVQ